MRNQLAASMPTSTLVSRLRNGSRLASRLEVLKVVCTLPQGYPKLLVLLLLACLTPMLIRPTRVLSGRARNLLNPQMVIL